KPSEAVSSEKRRRQLQGDLDNIVLMAMRKEISGRYTSAEQLSNDIRYYLEEWPFRARGSTFQYRAVKFIIRNKWGVFAAALVFVSLVSGIAVSLWQARKAKLEAL